MKKTILFLLLTSSYASASTWRHHACKVTFDDKTFNLSVYSKWDRCIGMGENKRYKASLKTKFNADRVTGTEYTMFTHTIYEFKNISRQFPGKFAFMLPYEDETNVKYSGRGLFTPSYRGNPISFTLTCELGNSEGRDCSH
jgi:hypothetical protein